MKRWRDDRAAQVLRLWEETYAAFNLVPRPGPAFAPQMAGWFRKKIAALCDSGTSAAGLKNEFGVDSKSGQHVN